MNLINDMLKINDLEQIDLDSPEDKAKVISHIYATITSATALITAFANKRGNDSVMVLMHASNLSRKWIDDYGDKFGNPVADLDTFFRKTILYIRDETEFFLEVRDRPKGETE